MVACFLLMLWVNTKAQIMYKIEHRSATRDPEVLLTQTTPDNRKRILCAWEHFLLKRRRNYHNTRPLTRGLKCLSWYAAINNLFVAVPFILQLFYSMEMHKYSYIYICTHILPDPEISKISLQFLKGSDIRKTSAASLPDILEINNLPQRAWKIPPLFSKYW